MSHTLFFEEKISHTKPSELDDGDGDVNHVFFMLFLFRIRSRLSLEWKKTSTKKSLIIRVLLYIYFYFYYTLSPPHTCVMRRLLFGDMPLCRLLYKLFYTYNVLILLCCYAYIHGTIYYNVTVAS